MCSASSSFSCLYLTHFVVIIIGCWIFCVWPSGERDQTTHVAIDWTDWDASNYLYITVCVCMYCMCLSIPRFNDTFIVICFKLCRRTCAYTCWCCLHCCVRYGKNANNWKCNTFLVWRMTPRESVNKSWSHTYTHVILLY